ncbi:DUF1080 domain-containing protein [Stieleria sp. TO1_6]|nr:DUF1080 domain-containing protein [Stieleria tagensis]
MPASSRYTRPLRSFSPRGFARDCVDFGLLLLVLNVAATAAGQESATPTPDSAAKIKLFDGKTLDGWNGDSKWFRVENGEIIAGSATEKIPHNQFLCTDQTYGDFELSVEAKLVGQGNNAGVQFRTKRIPGETEVIGYQADIGWMPNGTCWGALYDESRRRKFLAESPDVAAQVVRKGQWNTLKVIAKGKRIQIFLNGKQTVDYVEQDPEIEQQGVIALQVHSGPPLEVHYRNLQFRTL